MKYCSHCGAEVHDEAVVCVKCGCNITQAPKPAVVKQEDSTMTTIVKVFLIIGCVVLIIADFLKRKEHKQ